VLAREKGVGRKDEREREGCSNLKFGILVLISYSNFEFCCANLLKQGYSMGSIQIKN
jgi:hypothetical protein